jgi:2-keto-4-pentenoate hydratase/2-oxohepta-3-ene-1,7-dioic acid hydratase in catechol pathway
MKFATFKCGFNSAAVGVVDVATGRIPPPHKADEFAPTDRLESGRFLKPNDLAELEIEKIGVLKNQVTC